MEAAMCRYSLEHVRSREARRGETVTIQYRSEHHVPAMVGSDNCVVCVQDGTRMQINGPLPPNIGFASGDTLIFAEYISDHLDYPDGFRSIEGAVFSFNDLAERLHGCGISLVVEPDYVTEINLGLDDPVTQLSVIAYDAAADAAVRGIRVAREHAGTTLASLFVLAVSIGAAFHSYF